MIKQLLTLLLLGGSLYAQHCMSPQRIQNHINILAHDSLQGRATGTEAELKAARYISEQFQKAGLKPLGGNGSWLQEFEFQASSHGVKGRSGKANNVVGFLDNQAKYTIVIGGHYDHLGLGDDGNSLDAHAAGQIHNGADDNASGTAGVLELACYYAGNGIKEPFNFLFVCFSGEELGLFGSAYFVDHSEIATDNMMLMINMDMIGRLPKEKPSLTISGTGTAAELMPILQTFKSAALDLQLDSAGVGPSDHTSFYHKKVPALHFFTGTHLDYHKPSDDADKINSQGAEVVLNIITGLIDKLPTDRKIEWLKTRNPSQGGTPAFKVSLGIMPSYAASENGLKVEAVLDGKPAQKAGLLDGDIITAIGAYPVKEIQTYMEALSKFAKGDKAKVSIMRAGKPMEFEVQF